MAEMAASAGDGAGDLLLDDDVDVCIVGSGPDALATLSALHEPLSQLKPSDYNRAKNNIDSRARAATNSALKVCVVSPSAPAWLQDWEARFDALEITHLRSPSSAQPDMFSVHSLLEFAQKHGREHELVDVGVRDAEELVGKGKYGRLRDLDEGLFDIPSQALFVDFCRGVAEDLPHRCVQGRVVGIDRDDADDDKSPNPSSHRPLRVRVLQQDGRRGYVSARNVVLAIGAAGPSSVPRTMREKGIPPRLVTHTNNVAELVALKEAAAAGRGALHDGHVPEEHRDVLVVGGGLSAVQAAIAFAKRGSKVVLASRRPLTWQHFDLPVPWLDRRSFNGKKHAFYATPLEGRPAFIKQARRSASVPPWYRRKLADSGVECVVAEVAEASYESRCGANGAELTVGGPTTTGAARPPPAGPGTFGGAATTAVGAVRVTFKPPAGEQQGHVANPKAPPQSKKNKKKNKKWKKEEEKEAVVVPQRVFGRVVLGTGSAPDCLGIALVAALHAKWPVDVVEGLPVVGEDLSWAPELPNVYVVGSLAALRIGPDAANLTGARRAAEVVAQNLGVYDQLEDASVYNVFNNSFSALLNDDSDDGSDDDEETQFVDERNRQETQQQSGGGDDLKRGEQTGKEGVAS